jgi:hypothetical protein
MRIIAKRKVADTAKVLMVISITLLIYGVVLNLTTSHTLDPIKDVEVVNPEENTISITPSDGSEVVSDGESNNSNKSTNTNNRINKDDSISSIDKKNEILRKEIEKEFSVSVKYGKETEGYAVGGVTTTSITDPNLVNNKLDDLYDTLSLYPEGIFKEIKDGGIPLTIYLINNYSEYGITGVTDSSYDYANISIAAIYDFPESFYHESYHYMERYMFKKKANFNSWDSLNPDDFEWNTIDGSLSYSNTFSESAPFVNNYAQTSGAEDRASTFEYMMANTKASCLNKNNPIWYKATYIAMTMESVFNTVSSDNIEYWERFIKN